MTGVDQLEEQDRAVLGYGQVVDFVDHQQCGMRQHPVAAPPRLCWPGQQSEPATNRPTARSPPRRRPLPIAQPRYIALSREGGLPRRLTPLPTAQKQTGYPAAFGGCIHSSCRSEQDSHDGAIRKFARLLEQGAIHHASRRTFTCNPRRSWPRIQNRAVSGKPMACSGGVLSFALSRRRASKENSSEPPSPASHVGRQPRL